MTAILISLATFVMTLLGGLFALRFKDRLHLILGFSAGAVIGVAFFDLIPEALALSRPRFSDLGVLSLVIVGFIVYMVLERALSAQAEDDSALRRRRTLGAGSLAIHSFLDGFAIGLGFKVSAAVALVVSVAVLVHDFSDGVNTVGFVLGKQGDDRSARRWLLVDAVAPVLGVVSTLLLDIDAAVLGLLLALFAGFFLYVSASDLLPESYHQHRTGLTTAMTVLGVATMYLVVRLAGG